MRRPIRHALALLLTLFLSTSEAQTDILPPDGRSGMVLIPSGAFTMGSDKGEDDERPMHQVSLDSFYIDRTEVTVSQYADFLRLEHADPPFKWHEARESSHGNKPVVGIDWFDAREYCRWRGGRLPTEAEWEKAARGTDGRTYPWGEEHPTKAHVNAGQTKWVGYDSLARAARYERGKSPYGVYDMAGSLWEWVADWYDQAYYQSAPRNNPPGPAAGPLRVLRGGAWNNDSRAIRAANRAAYAPNARRNDVGFRCAKNAD
ncbi:MAG: formylglycine-generating enzyme family protein [Nitrospiraceae bacterium]|nr:formylglycine-generating enzyme family protein [Nitrospiraceae bacterium]